MQVEFEAGKNGTPITFIRRKVAFPPRDAQVSVGDWWEVEIAGENPSKTVYFLTLLSRVSTAHEREEQALAEEAKQAEIRKREAEEWEQYRQESFERMRLRDIRMQSFLSELPKLLPNIEVADGRHNDHPLTVCYHDSDMTIPLAERSIDGIDVIDMASLIEDEYQKQIEMIRTDYVKALEAFHALRAIGIQVRIYKSGEPSLVVGGQYLHYDQIESSSIDELLEYVRQLLLSPQEWSNRWKTEFSPIAESITFEYDTLDIRIDTMWIRCDYKDRHHCEKFLQQVAALYKAYNPALQEVLRESPLRLIKDTRHKIIPSPDEMRLVAYHNRGMWNDSGIDVDPLRSLFPVRRVYNINVSDMTIKPIEFYATFQNESKVYSDHDKPGSGELILQYQWSDTYAVGGFYARGEYIPFDHPTSTHTDSGTVILARFPTILLP